MRGLSRNRTPEPPLVSWAWDSLSETSFTCILHHKDSYSFIMHLPVFLSKYLYVGHAAFCPGDEKHHIRQNLHNQQAHMPRSWQKIKSTHEMHSQIMDMINTETWLAPYKNMKRVAVFFRQEVRKDLDRWHLGGDLEKKGKQLCKEQRGAEKIDAKYLLKQYLVITGIINIWIYSLYLCVYV